MTVAVVTSTAAGCVEAESVLTFAFEPPQEIAVSRVADNKTANDKSCKGLGDDIDSISFSENR
jgi:hypothetical protein